MLVIHENRGLTDWVRTVADRLAANGYIAIALDMLSGSGSDVASAVYAQKVSDTISFPIGIV